MTVHWTCFFLLVTLLGLTTAQDGSNVTYINSTNVEIVYPGGSLNDTYTYLANSTLPFLTQQIFPLLPPLLQDLDISNDTATQVKTLINTTNAFLTSVYLDNATKAHLTHLLQDIDLSDDTVSTLNQVLHTTAMFINNSNAFLDQNTTTELHTLFTNVRMTFDSVLSSRTSFQHVLNTTSSFLDYAYANRDSFIHLVNDSFALIDFIISNEANLTRALGDIIWLLEDSHFTNDTHANIIHGVKSFAMTLDALHEAMVAISPNHETRDELHALVFQFKVFIGLFSALIAIVIIGILIILYKNLKPGPRAEYYQMT